MDRNLFEFARQWMAVAIATAMPVVFCAFVSIPFSLGGHPGEARLATNQLQAPERHMT